MFKRITVLSLVLCIICLSSTEIFANSFREEDLPEDYLEVSLTKRYTYRISAQVKAYKGSSVETIDLTSKNIKH